MRDRTKGAIGTLALLALLSLCGGMAVRHRRAIPDPDWLYRSPFTPQGFRPGPTYMSGANVVVITGFHPPTLGTQYRHGFKAGDVVEISGVAGPYAVNGTRLVTRVPDATHFEIADEWGRPIDVSLRCADCHKSPVLK